MIQIIQKRDLTMKMMVFKKDSGLASGTLTLNDGSPLKRGMKFAQTMEAVSNFANKVGDKLKNATHGIQWVNGACTAAEIIGAISVLVMANEAIQILQTSSTLFEGIQKAQVADSKQSPIHDIANSLTEKKTTTYDLPDNKKAEIYGSGMEGEAVTSLYGNTKTNPSDPSVNSFNLADGIRSTFAGFGANLSTYKSCLIARLAGAVISLLVK